MSNHCWLVSQLFHLFLGGGSEQVCFVRFHLRGCEVKGIWPIRMQLDMGGGAGGTAWKVIYVSLIKPMDLSYVSSSVLFFSSFTVVVD